MDNAEQRGPAPNPWVPRPGLAIRRPRVVSLLRGRFDHRLTTVTGPGGAGKTTSLALAMEENRIDPFGIDLWYAASRHDKHPNHLVAGLLRTAGSTPTATVDDNLTALREAVLAHAPREVVVIVDDAHLLGAGPSTDVLAAILDQLPANGHLLLSGRVQPPLGTGRLRALGHLLEIVEPDLAFDDDELAELIRRRLSSARHPTSMVTDASARAIDLPRLAAMADLRLRARPGADTDFLWEEVLAELGSDRLSVLIRSSVLATLDDELVGAVSGGTWRAEDLVAGLPMVELLDDGTYRLHLVVRDALRGRAQSSELQRGARLAAEAELARGNLRAAAELFVSAGETPAATDVIRRYAMSAGLRRNAQDQVVMQAMAEELFPGSALAQLLRVEMMSGELSVATDVTRIADDAWRIAALAQADGDGDLEAAALYRAIVWVSLDHPVPGQWVDRLVALAATVPFAAQTARYVLAERAMFAGEPEQALGLLQAGAVVDAELDFVDRSGLLCSLGRPEEVGLGLTTADLAGMPDGAELYVGFALWNRGQLTPEVALPIALSMTAQTLSRGLVHPIVAILGVTSFMALGGGDIDTAVRHVAQARDEERFGCSAHLRAFTTMAEAATALVRDGEAEAARILDGLLEEIPLVHWPIRAHLLGLPMLYVLCPQTRPVLDRCRFGPALDLACRAARALVRLRETGDVRSVAELPWENDAGLRAHVLPPHLCELALAGTLANRAGAERLLGHLPDLRTNLGRVEEIGVAAVARAARQRLRTIPPRPRQHTRVVSLGSLQVMVGDVAVDHPDWIRRARVRDLMALLIEERRITRARAAAACWPELGEAAAARNLRVTLSYLQKALEPSRAPRSAAGIVHATGEHLSLDTEVEIDADDFVADMHRATELDRAGAPTSALALYGAALDRYRGRYLAEVTASWAEATQARLHLLAVGGMLRAGELELATGEPERAIAWATRASLASEGNERAARLHASCLAGIGDRLGAVRVLRAVVERLADEAVEPELETAQLLRRLLNHQATGVDGIRRSTAG